MQITENPVPVLPVTVESADGSHGDRDRRRAASSRSGSTSPRSSSPSASGDHVVGRDISTTFDEAENLPLVTRAHDVSAEAVLSLEADARAGRHRHRAARGDRRSIRDAGVPVVVFPPRPGRRDRTRHRAGRRRARAPRPRAARSRTRTEAAIAAVTDDIPTDGKPPRVAFLYLRGQAGVYLIGGPGSGADSMIEAAGGIDAGTAIGLDRPFTPITSEALVAAAPDVILMTTTGLESVGGIDGLLADPGHRPDPGRRDTAGSSPRRTACSTASAPARPTRCAELIAELLPRATGGAAP